MAKQNGLSVLGPGDREVVWAAVSGSGEERP